MSNVFTVTTELKLNKEYNFILLPFGDGVGLVRK